MVRYRGRHTKLNTTPDSGLGVCVRDERVFLREGVLIILRNLVFRQRRVIEAEHRVARRLLYIWCRLTTDHIYISQKSFPN